MAKKGLATLANKQINSTAKPSAPIPDEAEAARILEISEEEQQRISSIVDNALIGSPKRKPGRPSALTAPDEVNYTLKMSAALIRRIKAYAIEHEAETGEKLTQKEIIIKAVETYLNNKTI